MAEPNCEYTCSTNVHDERAARLSRYPQEIDFTVPHLGVQLAAAHHNSNAPYDNDLAETRSAPSGGHRSLEAGTEHFTLSRSRSGDNLNLETSSRLQTQPLVEYRNDTSANEADDIDDAMYQRFTLSHVPSWGDTTYQDTSTTSLHTLVGVPSNGELNVRREEAACVEGYAIPAPTIEEYGKNPLTHEIATRIFRLFNPSPFLTRTDEALSTHFQENSQAGQSTCAFCGSDFTGLDHKQKSIDHIRATHLNDRSISTAVKCVDPHPMRLSKPPQLAVNKKNFTALQLGLPPSRVVALCPMHHKLQMPDNLTAIGTKWQDELRARRRATRHIPASVNSNGSTQSALQHDRKALLYTILTLVNCSGAGVNPEKMNDLFNGLDLVIEDLLHRRPKNATVRSIAETFRKLKHEAGPDTRSYSCHAVPRRTAATTSFNICPKSQHTDSSPPSGSGSFSESGKQASTSFAQDNAPTNGSSSAEGTSGPVPATFVNGRKKKSRSQHLACPFTKYDEVHGRPPTCRFPGAANMSALRAHLTSGEHLIFMTYCQACADYVYDRNEWEAHHQHVGGSNRQIRGAGVLSQWRGMFKKLFPDSEWIPHPHIGNRERIANDALLHRQDIHVTAMDHDYHFNFNDPPTRPPPHIENESASPSMTTTIHNTFSGHVNMAVYNTRSRVEETVFLDGEGRYTSPGNSFPGTNQAFLDETLAAADALPPTLSPIPYALGMYLNDMQSGVTRSEPIGDPNRSSGVYPDYVGYQWSRRSSPPPRTMYNSTPADPGHAQSQGDTTDHVGIATLSQVLALLRCCAHALDTGDITTLTRMITRAHSYDSGQLSLIGDALVNLIIQTEQRQRRTASYTQHQANGTVDPREVDTDPLFGDGRQWSDSILFQDQPLRSLESWEDELVAPTAMGDTRQWVPPADYPSTIFPDISVSIG